MTTTMRRLFLAAVAAMASVAFPGVVAADDGLDPVRDATRDFRAVTAAEAAGYGILAGTPLEACIDEPGEGAMGFHYVNGDLVGDSVLDPAMPEALLYIPRGDGELRLVGVEYVVFAEAWDAENNDPPSLFGHEFHLVGEPNRYELPPFYELHAWAWADNPSGTFNDWNPDVSCDPQLPPTSAVAGDGPAGSLPAPLLAIALVVAAVTVGALRRRTLPPHA